jgi:hypothetical protein
MKFTQVPSQYSKGIGEVKATIEVWVHAKAPSRRVSRESSTALKLFKQRLHSCRLSIAEKRGTNNQQEQSKAPLTVQYEIHTTTKPTQQPTLISTSEKQSMGACKGAFPLPIL